MIPVFIQIRRWLMQPKVRRCLGFISSVVGLLCYALSSSFNHLFGQWNLFKIFLYFGFSFIICLSTLFSKVWQFPTTLLFKAGMTVLVLLATSVYSFFYDKAVTGKPDAYILISCLAFAITFLSLSKQTGCGFGMDLSNFFLGCLIIQLMKINLLLAIVVGGGLSYSLIIFHSSLDATPESEFFDDHIVIQVEYSQEANTNSATQAESQHVDTDSAIQMDSLQVNGALIIPQLKAYIGELEEKEGIILLGLYKYVEKYIEDYDFPNIQVPIDDNLLIDSLPPETISSLQETVKLMVAAGFEKECCHMYIGCRKLFLQHCILKLELSEFNNGEFHIDLIEKWRKAWYIALRILFPSERRLCNQVFFGFSSVGDLSFMEVCKELINDLLNFAGTVASGSRSPELLFRILDVFETLRDLIPELESLFSDQYSVLLRNEAIMIRKRLGEAIRGTFMELENLIRRDPAKAAVPGGGLHPITRYVMNYLRVACRSRISLEQVFEEYPQLDDSVASTSSLSIQMDWIMELLESNLESKSKVYKDTALSYVFLMNNGMYIVQKAKDSELGTLLGDDWIRKHAAKVRQYHMHYQRSSWNKVLGILKLDSSNGSVGANGAAKTMKEKIKLFNAQFDETCKVQSSWFVFDEQLREEIRISLERILLPAYGNFIARFRSVPKLGKQADKYIKYGMEDIEAKLKDLFQGIEAKLDDLFQGSSGSNGRP